MNVLKPEELRNEPIPHVGPLRFQNCSVSPVESQGRKFNLFTSGTVTVVMDMARNTSDFLHSRSQHISALFKGAPCLLSIEGSLALYLKFRLKMLRTYFLLSQ